MKTNKKGTKIAKKARMNCEKWRSYFRENIAKYHEMHAFIYGEQWLDNEENDMIKTFRKVPLVSNQLASLCNFLLGEQQQNTPQLQVVPLTNCKEETAELREAIIKDITLSTDAKTVYQVAASQAFIGGYGAFLWDTDYSNPMSFDVDIVPRYFKDATLCYWDAGAEHINKIDGMYCGFVSRMTRKKFKEIYGSNVEDQIHAQKSEIAATQEEVKEVTNSSNQLDAFEWATDDAITINDYYERKAKTITIYKLSSNRVVTQDELDTLIEQSQAMMLESGEELPESEMITIYDQGMPVRIEDKKESVVYNVVHYKFAGDYILEKSEFPSEHLPLIFVDQNSYYNKNGKQICRPYFIDCKDTQRYINYLRTQSAYILKISRYDQYMGSKKNVASNDTASQWRNPTDIKGMLTFDESPTGVVPKQLMPPELSQSLLSQYQLAIEDIYRITGLYPTRMGQEGNEISGAAVDARTRQGSYVTYVAFNSINRAITAGGTIVNEMIPIVFDSERVMSIMTKDKGAQTITLNQQMDQYGEVIKNDIKEGEFEVRLLPGPSYEGQKVEALNALKEILQANPQAFNLIADLYAENLPLPNTIELKNRFKTVIPPQIIQAGKTGEIPPQQAQQPDPSLLIAQAKIQSDMQNIQLKQQELMLKAKAQETDTEHELAVLENERIKLATQLEEQKLRYLAETQRTNQDAAIAHADNLVKILTHKQRGD